MTELNATIVTTDTDWEGIYINGTLKKEDHSVSINDISLAENHSINTITNEQYNITRLGQTTLPKSLTKLKELTEFANTVEENYNYWVDKIPELYKLQNKIHVMTTEADNIFGVGKDKGKVILALFSKTTTKNTQTPLGKEPLLKIDHENSVTGDGPAAYKLIEQS